jgi:FkbM family methyltransferase
MFKKIFLYLKIQKLLISNIFVKNNAKVEYQKKALTKLNLLLFENKIPFFFTPIIFKFFKGYTPKVTQSEVLSIELFRKASEIHSFASNSNVFRKFVLNSQNANYEYWDFALFCTENAGRSFSKDLQDLWVLFESAGQEKLKFLEIGAGDGVWKSNCKLLQDLGWEGLSIEPNPVLVKRFIQNRTNKILDVALVPDNSPHMQQENPSVNLYYMYDRETQGTIFHSTLTPEDVLTSNVKASSISRLFAEGLIQNDISYVSLDTEGGELQFLMDLLRKGIYPRLVTIEHNHNSQLKKSISQFMSMNGYIERFTGIGRNDFFYKLNDKKTV